MPSPPGRIIAESKTKQRRASFMRGKRIAMDATEAFVMYANFRIQDKLPTMEVYQKIGESIGASAATIRVRAKRERWEEKVSRLLPSLVATLPTTTTACEVLDKERRTHLENSRKMFTKLNKYLDYFDSEFEKARACGNHVLARQMVDAFSRLVLAFVRLQQISMNACCDAGSARAPSEQGKPYVGDAINLYLRPMMAKPRIPQPGVGPIELKLAPEIPASPTQENGYPKSG